MLYRYDNEIFGDMILINEVVKNILKDIKPIINDEDLCFDVRLILSELLINCHEHGNKYDTEKCIKLLLSIDFDNIHIEVKDEGIGFNNTEKYNIHDFKSSGRGLMIVKSLVDKLEIYKNNVRCDIRI